MRTMHVQVRRISVVSSRPFDDVLRSLAESVGHADIEDFHQAVATAETVADLDRVVQRAIGSSGLMEFARFDVGKVLGKERAQEPPRPFACSSAIPSS